MRNTQESTIYLQLLAELARKIWFPFHRETCEDYSFSNKYHLHYLVLYYSELLLWTSLDDESNGTVFETSRNGIRFRMRLSIIVYIELKVVSILEQRTRDSSVLSSLGSYKQVQHLVQHFSVIV